LLKVDDKEVDNKKIPHIILFLVTLDETFRAVLYGGSVAVHHGSAS
jgi:hypothetical protein